MHQGNTVRRDEQQHLCMIRSGKIRVVNVASLHADNNPRGAESVGQVFHRQPKYVDDIESLRYEAVYQISFAGQHSLPSARATTKVNLSRSIIFSRVRKPNPTPKFFVAPLLRTSLAVVLKKNESAHI